MGNRNLKPNTGRKLTGRQLVFADALARGRSQVEAGKVAGYQPNRGHLSVLANSEPVRKHILSERRAEYAQHTVTLQWWRETLSRVAVDAERDGDRTSLIAVLRLAGQHLGALSGDSESEVSRDFASWLGVAAARALAADSGSVLAAPSASSPSDTVGVVDAAARVLPVGGGES